MPFLSDKVWMGDYAQKALKQYFSQVKDNGFYTHVTMNKPMGKWIVEGRKGLVAFYNINPKIIEDELISIAEVPPPYSQMVVDVDKSVDGTVPKELYTNDELLEVVEVYQKVLKEMIRGIKKKHLDCVVLTKHPYIKTNIQTGKKTIKHGFHLQFPYIFIHKDHQKIVNRQVQSLLPEGGVDDVSGKPWLLYGHKKSRISGTYELNVVVDVDGEIHEPEDWVGGYTLYDINEKPYQATMNHWTWILSHFVWGRFECVYEDIDESKVKIEKKKKSPKSHPKLESEQELKSCSSLIKHINSSYAEDYDSWVKIGLALYTCLNGSEEGLDLWDEFSQKCPEKYGGREEVEKVWHSMNSDSCTKGTLIHYMKLSNPHVKFC